MSTRRCSRAHGGVVTFRVRASGQLMVLGRAGLVFKIFFPKSENNFEAGFSGFKFFCALRRSWKITNVYPRKVGLQIIS